MNWNTITGVTKYQRNEFPEDPEQYAQPMFIYALDKFAISLGASVFPSPVTGALARLDGSVKSRHYAINRQSDACDLFCNCQIFKAWSTALGFFNGVGVYFDTKFRGGPWPMIHVDQRPTKLVWYREKGVYHYPGDDMSFYEALGRKLSQPVMMMARK